MNKKEPETLAQEAAKIIKTEHNLSDFRQMLTKIPLEAALNGELDAHLGYSKHAYSDTSNNRNGISRKQPQTEDGSIELAVPRDRDSSFEPQPVKKHQRRFTSMNDKNSQPVRQRHDNP